MLKPHWTEAWDRAVMGAVRKGPILLACDFDGTLAHIAPTPADAKLSESTRHLLQKLSQCEGVILTFISGREINNLKSLVDIRDAIYCGNHGMQIEGGGFSWESSDANSLRPILASALNRVRCETTRMDGVIVEDKGLTASIHWRLASDRDRAALHPLLTTITKNHPGLLLTHGKAVWELRPDVKKNKGSALTYLIDLAKLPSSRALYFGDDQTDEAAFQAIPDGITVRVGSSETTFARFHAKNVDDISKLLFCILATRNGGSFDLAPQNLRTAMTTVRHTSGCLFHGA